MGICVQYSVDENGKLHIPQSLVSAENFQMVEMFDSNR